MLEEGGGCAVWKTLHHINISNYRVMFNNKHVLIQSYVYLIDTKVSCSSGG